MNPQYIIIAPFDVYLAPEGTAFPDPDTTPAAPWALLGTNGKRSYSEDGVVATHEQSLYQHRTAGSTGPVKAARTDEGLLIELTVEDMSLETYAKVLNGKTVTDVPAASGTPGERKITLRQGPDVATFAMIVRGPSPYLAGAYAQYEVPRVFQAGNPAPAFTKGGAAGLACQFAALEDPDASSDDERFGHLVAMDAEALP